MGNLILSLNPYRPLNLYDEQTLRLYRHQRITDLPPHIFGVAGAAYRELTLHGLNQAVLLTGESGSGKTENTKLIIHTVASLASNTKEAEKVTNRLLQFNQVLEAFGNAKTEKNDNASRFGKYIDIAFDSHGDTLGANLTAYQLDKSRVIFQNPRERNFHVFYQILAGADVHLLKALKLQRNVEKYSILRFSGVYKLEGLDEKREFVITKEALEILGFSAAECQCVFQIVAAVLKLGNIQFLPKTNVDGTESATMLNEHEAGDVAELLECPDVKSLVRVLNKGSIQLRDEQMEMTLSAQEASALRDQLCKALYNRLVTWIISKINSGLSYLSSSSRSLYGVLDMYGFENLEHNGFEQFLINYASEKLHCFVMDLVLKYEQEEYIREGLPWNNVPYTTNSEVCDIIEKGHHSLLAILDEVCLREDSVSDEHLLHKFTRHQGAESVFQPPQERAGNNVPMDQFKIRHFAGTVTYHSRGFAEKNLDILPRSVAEVMHSCRMPLVKELFPDGNPARTIAKRPLTMAASLRASLSALLSGLSGRSFTLIKCIKPNDSKRPGFFDEERVKHQVRYMRLVDQVQVRRAGYAYRDTFENFMRHYKMLTSLTWPLYPGDAKDGVRLILLTLAMNKMEYIIGRTKVYIKFYETINRLDDLRRAALQDVAVLIQKSFRGYRTRKHLKLMAINSAPSSSQSSKDSGRRGERLSKLLLRSLCNDQHSSVSSSMDSSQSVPYTPICNNISQYPSAMPFTITPTTIATSAIHTATIGTSTSAGPSAVSVATSPHPPPPTAAAILSAVVAATTAAPAPFTPVAFVNPTPPPPVPPKPKITPSMSINSIPRSKPPPPMRRTATIGNCVDRRLDPNEAARRITECCRNYHRYKFLLFLLRHLPSMSPVDQRWPPSPSFLMMTNLILRDTFHRWRCRKYRLRFDQTSISRMREKVAASSIFLGKKITYPKTVPHPFRGDYVRLRQNVKWRKLAADTNDQYVVFADIMPKINRTTGRPSYVLSVISTKAFLVIDQRTMIVKYRIQAGDIARISVSPYADDIVVIHLKPGELFKRKGDFMFQCAHVIEMVTKLCLVVQNITQKPPEIMIAPEFPVYFGSSMLLVHFDANASQGTPDMTPDVTPPGSVKVARKNNRMEISLSLDKSG
ncbi:unconventional myosin-Ia-like isoform X2 [Paramacrobiotus metropolitanus]|nr:unconventional myosin-Ia-like isoform X2 [Paramacrobiotus metropolitanus]